MVDADICREVPFLSLLISYRFSWIHQQLVSDPNMHGHAPGPASPEDYCVPGGEI